MSITIAVVPGYASQNTGRPTRYLRRMTTPARHTCDFRATDGFWDCVHNHVVPNTLADEAAARAAIPQVASLVEAPPLTS